MVCQKHLNRASLTQTVSNQRHVTCQYVRIPVNLPTLVQIPLGVKQKCTGLYVHAQWDTKETLLLNASSLQQVRYSFTFFNTRISIGRYYEKRTFWIISGAIVMYSDLLQDLV